MADVLTADPLTWSSIWSRSGMPRTCGHRTQVLRAQLVLRCWGPNRFSLLGLGPLSTTRPLTSGTRLASPRVRLRDREHPGTADHRPGGAGVPLFRRRSWYPELFDATLAGHDRGAALRRQLPGPAWLSTSTMRPDAEAVRRNAYFRLFGMDIAHGTDTNAPFAYEKPDTANKLFVEMFEELLYELWRAIENVNNLIGPNAADIDRIFRLAEQICFMLRSRRQNALLGREELAAVTAMGWLDLTLSANTPVVNDLRANATNQADRLRFIGERVGLAPHSKAAAFFSMAEELSVLLRALEGRWVTTRRSRGCFSGTTSHRPSASRCAESSRSGPRRPDAT